ncbi:MAG TPA: N-acetylmuramoyl-L-alanine amidase [Oscillatoriaceae cyanobacterium]
MFPALVFALAAGLCFLGLTQFTHLHPAAIATPAPLVSPVDQRASVTLPLIQEFSPNQDDRPANETIDTLIIHDTESPGVSKAQTIANFFLNPSSQVSAHYIIGKDGEIIQCVLDGKRAWHAGPSHYRGRTRVNDFSIGIELVNAQTGKDPFTDAQYNSLIALTADLMDRFPIRYDHITGHHNVSDYPTIKRDPAKNFSWQRYLDGVRKFRTTYVVRREPLTPEAARGRLASLILPPLKL